MKLLPLLALSVCLFGCGGDATIEPPSGGSPMPRENVTLLPPNVSMSSVTADSITLDADVPGLTAGSILVSGEGRGVARKVLARTANPDGTVRLTTANAGWGDIFTDGTARIQAKANLSAVTQDMLPEGVTLVNRTRDPYSCELQLTNFGIEVQRNGGDSVTAVKLNGTVRVEFDIVIVPTYVDGAPSRIEFKTITNATFIELQIAGTAKMGGAFGEVEIVPEVTLSPITFMVGPVPVVIVPVFKLGASLRGDGEIGLEAAMNGTFRQERGWLWQYATGFEPIDQEDFSGTLEAAKNLYASFTLELAFPSAELHCLIYNIAGPYMAGKAGGQVEFKIQTAGGPLVNVTAKAFASAGVGVRAHSIFDSLPAYEFNRTWSSDPIWTNTYDAGDLGIVIK